MYIAENQELSTLIAEFQNHSSCTLQKIKEFLQVRSSGLLYIAENQEPRNSDLSYIAEIQEVAIRHFLYIAEDQELSTSRNLVHCRISEVEFLYIAETPEKTRGLTTVPSNPEVVNQGG